MELHYLPAMCRRGTSELAGSMGCYRRGDFRVGGSAMAQVARITSERKRIGFTKRFRRSTSNLAKRLAEVQALRKQVQKAEARRLH